MSRQERYGTRDLTYSKWHRTLADDLTYIDVDALEYCQRCREPLALIEIARDVGQSFKATPVLRKLAARAGVPAYCALYRIEDDTVVSFRVRKLVPVFTDWCDIDTDGWVKLLRLFRDQHQCELV